MNRRFLASVLCAVVAVLWIGRWASGADAQPSVVVEAKLLFKSPTPTPDMHVDIWVYGEGLVVYRYEVAKVVQGSLKEKNILVAHWGLKRRIEQPIAKAEVGSTATLSLVPYDKGVGLTDKLYRSDTTKDTTSPVFYDVGQKLVLPAAEQGRWNYGVDIGRVMQQFHFLRNQLKLVVIGDCQGWFSSRTRLYYGDENLRTPVALCMTQERSCLSFYETLVNDYVVKAPKMEWVVFAYHTRWVNGASTWRGFGEFANKFKNSPGYKYDQAHAGEVFKSVEHAPITIEHITAAPGVGDAWKKAPWGELPRDKNGAPGGRSEALGHGGKAHYQLSAERWAQWERIVKLCVDCKIRVLAYTTPIHPATAKLAAKDKNGTSEEGYKDQVRRMREMEQKYKGYFFFYDYNNCGDNGLTDEDFGNMDHCHMSGSIKCTTAVNAYLQDLMKRNNIVSRPVGKAKN